MSLRFLRPAMAPAAAGLTVACVLLGTVLLGTGPSYADQTRGQQWWLRELHVTQAWQTTHGAGVTVAVLDTGVARHQPDLAGAVLPGPDLTHSGETSASPYYDARGTAVASLIAGHGHGTGGAAGEIGVAPAAHILPVRVTLGSGDPLLANAHIAAALPAAIAAGIRYAVQQGAQVIDLPLDPAAATPASHPVPAAAAGRAAEQSAVSYALGHGVVLVAPAGDGATLGNAVNYPAAYPGVVSAGAFNNTFLKATFSSRQHYVTLTAPGDGVVAAAGPHGYTTLKSTSAASAIVAGIAALVRAQYPELSGAQVRRALEQGTEFRPNGKTGAGSGFGTADAARALAAAASIAGPQTRAGAGAVSRTQPDVPSVAGQQAITKRELTRAALISGAVLIVLLIPVAILALVRRRRARNQAAAAPAELDWPDYTQAAYREPEYAHVPGAGHGSGSGYPQPAGAGYGTGPSANGGSGLADGPGQEAGYGWPAASGETGSGSGRSDPGRNFLPSPASRLAASPPASGRRSGGGPDAASGDGATGPVFSAPAGVRDPGVHPPATRSRPPAEFDLPAGAGYPEASDHRPGTAPAPGESAAAGHPDLFHRAGRTGPGGRGSGAHSSGPRGTHGGGGIAPGAAEQGAPGSTAPSPAGHSAGHHGAGQHGAGHHSAGQHSAGHHGAGQHEAGHHEAGHHGAGHHGAGQHGAGHHEAGQHEAGHHGAGPHRAGSHGAGSHGTDPPGSGTHGAGAHGASSPGSGGRFRFGAARSSAAGGLGAAGAADAGAPGPGAPGTGAPGPGAPGPGAPGTGAPGTGAPGTGAPGRGAAAANGSSPEALAWPYDLHPAGPGRRDDTDTGPAAGPGGSAPLPRRRDDQDPQAGGFSGASSVTGMSPHASPPRPSVVGQLPPAPLMTPIHRSGVGSSPTTSGAPPWEPAVKPDSELPWTSMPPPPPVSGPDRPPGRAAPSVWDAGRQHSGPPGPPRRDFPAGAAGHGAANRGAAHDSAANDGAAHDSAADHEPAGYGAAGHSAENSYPAEDEAIWVDSPDYGTSDQWDAPRWNPNASTETFPAVPDPDDDQG